MDTEVRSILLRMKEDLTANWIQGALQDDKMGVCLYGALVRAAGLTAKPGICSGDVKGRGSVGLSKSIYHLGDKEVTLEVTAILSEITGLSHNDLALWNDAEERTHEEIIELIDRALEKTADPAIPLETTPIL